MKYPSLCPLFFFLFVKLSSQFVFHYLVFLKARIHSCPSKHIPCSVLNVGLRASSSSLNLAIMFDRQKQKQYMWWKSTCWGELSPTVGVSVVNLFTSEEQVDLVFHCKSECHHSQVCVTDSNLPFTSRCLRQTFLHFTNICEQNSMFSYFGLESP